MEMKLSIKAEGFSYDLEFNGQQALAGVTIICGTLLASKMLKNRYKKLQIKEKQRKVI